MDHPDPQAPSPGDDTAAGSTPVGWVFWALLLLALVPVLAAPIRLAQAGWLPEGDDAMIARRSMSVLSADPPLTGQPSTASKLFEGNGVAGDPEVNASHAGPLEYWMLAGPYRALGWSPAALLVAVALVNAVSVAALVWLAWRQLGTAGALAAAVAVLAVAQRLGSVNLARPLNATILVLPLFAGLVATWAVLRGDRVAVVPAVATLTFAMQAHLGALALGGAALVTALAAFGWQTWRSTSRRWALVAGAAATLVAGWSLVVVEQLTGDPGNLVSIWDVARVRVPRASAGFALSAVADQVTRLAWPGHPVFPTADRLGPLTGARNLAAAAVVVLALLVASVWARRRGPATLAHLAPAALGTLALAVGSLTRGPASVEVGPPYQLSWLVAVGGLVWFTGAAFLAEAMRGVVAASPGGPRTMTAGRARGPAAVVAVLLMTGAVVTVAAGGPINRSTIERTSALTEAIRADLPRGTYKLGASGDWAYLAVLDAVSVDLLTHGYDVRLVRLGALPDEPQRRNLDLRAPTILIDSSDRPPAKGRLIARLGPLTDQPPPWNQPIVGAVSRSDVALTVDQPSFSELTLTNACAAMVAEAARAPDTAATRRQVARRLSACDAPTRRAVLEHLEFTGLDQHWRRMLAADLPAPYPPTGLSAWLIPA